MLVSVQANVRTAEASRKGLSKGLDIAFKSGAVTGMLVAGLALLSIAVYYYLLISFGVDEREIVNALVALGFGASLISIFARLGGGIFTKGADVGADLVGKVEAGIPEDDPRNPAVIADNVGDNVGDVAGMGADLYESYCGSVLAATALGASLAIGSSTIGIEAIVSPMLIAGIGIFCSLIGIFFVKTKEGATQKELLHCLLKGTGLSTLLVIAATAVVAWLGIISWGIFGSVFVGLIAGLIIGQATEYFTSDTYKPTQEIAESCKEGPATDILSGISTGMMSTAIPVVTIVSGIILSFAFTGGFSNITVGIYGIAFAAIGMLSTLGIQLATDAFGPIADNAGGNAEMAELPPEVRERTDALDSLGNTTAATGKGFAIGSAALTALALIAAYLDSIIQWLTTFSEDAAHKIGALTFSATASGYGSAYNVNDLTIESLVNIFQINIINPKFLCGIFIGAMAAFVFCALTISAVSKAAAEMVNEVRRQFREIKGILDGTGKPDYKRCVNISTEGALKAMIVPSILAISLPILVGLIFHVPGVLGLLTGALTTGFVLAIFLNNAGGAWDNAKKYIEAGNVGGKGSDAHKAAVIGDTVGDPFKDTSGPSLNILIKLMTIVSVVFAGLILKFGFYF